MVLPAHLTGRELTLPCVNRGVEFYPQASQCCQSTTLTSLSWDVASDSRFLYCCRHGEFKAIPVFIHNPFQVTQPFILKLYGEKNQIQERLAEG